MKTEPTKVIVLSVGDAQYPQDKLQIAIDSVRKTVRSLPCAEVVYEGSIMEDESADRVAADVKKLVFDAIIVNYVSWHITPYIMRTLIDYKDKPVLVWDFHSLLLDIKMMFTLMLTDEAKPLRMCKNCQRAFIAERSNMVFCSSACRNSYNEKK